MEPIAIIGMSLQFPQEATSPEAFWEMLMAGRSAWSEVPASRFNIDAFYHPNPDRIDAVCLHPPLPAYIRPRSRISNPYCLPLR